VFALGFSSGLPWAIIGSTLTIWLRESGMSRSEIGYLGAIFMVYAWNFLWAPLLDRVKLGALHRHLGQRRSWIAVAQGAIVLTTLAIALADPSSTRMLLIVAAFGVAIASATQDVAVDAYRIEIMPAGDQRRITSAATIATAGWLTGAGLPGALALYLASIEGWTAAYLLLAGIALCLILITLRLPEPTSERERQQKADEARADAMLGALASGAGAPRLRRMMNWLFVTVLQPFIEFFQRNGILLAGLILAFVVLFKVGEAFMGRMAGVFYVDIGFTKEQIATVSGLISWATILAFTLLSGLISVRMGIYRALLIGGIAMASTNLLFAQLAVVGASMQLFIVAVVLDNFTTALSTVAFVAFISHLTSRVYTATQYALLASLGNFSRTSLAAGSGLMVDALGGDWAVFFVITALMVTPSLILLLWIRRALTTRLGDVFSRARGIAPAVGPGATLTPSAKQNT
jgi:MFS transporter, PAT family, beta-lactamase induction signal transducer AmpG